MAENAPSARPNGQADRNLACAVCRSGCKQAAKVGARGQQHNSGQYHDPEHKATHRSAEKVADHAGTRQLELQPIFFCRVLLLNAGSECVEFSLHLGQRDSVLDANNGKDHLLAPRLKPGGAIQSRLVRHWKKDVGKQEFFRAVEALRSHADDRVRTLVNADPLAHDVGIGSEMVLPRRKANYGGFGSSGMVIVSAFQQTPEVRLDGHDLEVLTAHYVCPDWPRDTVGFEAKRLYRESGNGRKHGIAVTHIAH